MRRHVQRADTRDVSRQRPRPGILWPVRVHADGLVVHVTVSTASVADDVVVDVAVNYHFAGGNTLNVRARSDEALLLSRPEGEHECRVELQTAAGDHACELNRQSRTTSIVVGAGSIDVVVLACAKLRVRGLTTRRARVGANLAGIADV